MKAVAMVEIVSSIATTIAVIASLWQSGYSNQKRIRSFVRRTKDSAVCDENGNEVSRSICFSVEMTNIGRYDVTIKKAVLMSKYNKRHFPLTYFYSGIKDEQNNFPFTLKVGEYDLIQLFGDKDKVGDIESWYKVMLLDSANKKYKCKWVH